MSFRRVSVFFLAALVGVGAAFFLLPRAQELPTQQQGGLGGPGSVEVQGSQVDALGNPESQKSKPEEVPGAKKDGPGGSKPHGTGGNPKARRIREALSTPQHAFLAKTSPIWVQTRKVLRAHDQDVWAEKLSVLLEDISKGRRDLDLEGEFLLGRQNTLLESLWNADFPPALKEGLREPLSILGERIEAYEN
jgi:hypothetical protein